MQVSQPVTAFHFSSICMGLLRLLGIISTLLTTLIKCFMFWKRRCPSECTVYRLTHSRSRSYFLILHNPSPSWSCFFPRPKIADKQFFCLRTAAILRYSLAFPLINVDFSSSLPQHPSLASKSLFKFIKKLFNLIIIGGNWMNLNDLVEI